MTDVGGIAADALDHHGLPWLANKTIEMGRYGTSELLRLWNEKTYSFRL